MRKFRGAVFASLFAVCAALPVACSTSQSEAGAGQPCLTVTDCAPGLVCIPQSNGQRVCSDDLSGIQKIEGMDTGAPAEGAAPREGGNATEAGGGNDATAPQDSSMPPADTGTDTSPQGTDSGASDTGAG